MPSASNWRNILIQFKKATIAHTHKLRLFGDKIRWRFASSRECDEPDHRTNHPTIATTSILLLPVSWPSFNNQSFAVKNPIPFWFVSFPPVYPSQQFRFLYEVSSVSSLVQPKSEWPLIYSVRTTDDVTSLRGELDQKWTKTKLEFWVSFFEFGKIKN